MQNLRQYARPIAFGALTLLVFILLITAVSTDTISISLSSTRNKAFRLFDPDLEKANCPGFPGIVRAPRAFLILAILGTFPCFGFAALDALKKTAALGPIAPRFKFVMAAAAGFVSLCLLITWPIMMTIPSKAQMCIFPVHAVRVDAAPIVSVFAWLMACAMIPVAIFVSPPEKDAPPTVVPVHTGVEVIGGCTPDLDVTPGVPAAPEMPLKTAWLLPSYTDTPTAFQYPQQGRHDTWEPSKPPGTPNEPV